MITIMTKELLAKAKAHEWLYRFLVEGDPCSRAEADGMAGMADTGWAAYIALDALREDIEAMTAEIVKANGARFWWEVFGNARSTCPFASEGQCDLYHANDPEGTTCGYAFLGFSDADGTPCLCLRTKLAARAYPDLVTLPPAHRGAAADQEDEYLGRLTPTKPSAPAGEGMTHMDADHLRCKATAVLMNELDFADTDDNLILCDRILDQLKPIVWAMDRQEGEA